MSLHSARAGTSANCFAKPSGDIAWKACIGSLKPPGRPLELGIRVCVTEPLTWSPWLIRFALRERKRSECRPGFGSLDLGMSFRRDSTSGLGCGACFGSHRHLLRHRAGVSTVLTEKFGWSGADVNAALAAYLAQAN